MRRDTIRVLSARRSDRVARVMQRGIFMTGARNMEDGSRTAVRASLKPLLPLYAVVFAGFVGYSLMITVFTPMIMSNHDLLLRAEEPMSAGVILLCVLL